MQSMRKRIQKTKRYLVPVLCFVLLSFLLCSCRIETPSQYNDRVQNSSKININIKIECKTLLDNKDKVSKNLLDNIPKDGIILEEKILSVSEESSAFDLLLEVADKYDVDIEYSGSGQTAYISAINGIKEFCAGGESGWLYRVNGKFLQEGCGSCKLKNGDLVEFLFTCELGDLM